MKIARYKKLIDIKKENKKLLYTIHLQCSACFGYFGDSWQKCEDSSCHLFSYFPTLKQYKSIIRTKAYFEKKDEAYSRSWKNHHKEPERHIKEKHD